MTPIFRFELGGVLRAGAILGGLAAAAAGYVYGSALVLGGGFVGSAEARTVTASAGRGNGVLPNLSARWHELRERFSEHLPLLTNAGAVAFGSVTTSALGFVYWWTAARNFTPEAVGLAAAAISTMTLVGMVGELGLGTLMMGEGLLKRREAPGLVSASLFTAAGLSTALGLLFIGLAPLVVGRLDFLYSASDVAALFVAGCAIMGFAMVLDQTLIGALRGAQQMSRSVLFSVLKLVLLIGAAAVGYVTREDTILATWVFGQLAAILMFAGWLVSRGQPVWHRPETALLRGRVGKVLGHHFLNSVAQAPGFILPPLVATMLSPTINAAFFAALMLINVVCYLPAAMATVVFALSSAGSRVIRGSTPSVAAPVRRGQSASGRRLLSFLRHYPRDVQSHLSVDCRYQPAIDGLCRASDRYQVPLHYPAAAIQPHGPCLGLSRVWRGLRVGAGLLGRAMGAALRG